MTTKKVRKFQGRSAFIKTAASINKTAGAKAKVIPKRIIFALCLVTTDSDLAKK